MDVLLSLPLISYFFSSAITSWTTSANLLFFYITWSTFVLSHSPLAVHVGGVLAIRTLLWLVPSLSTLIFEVSVPSLAEGIKFGGENSLPPRRARDLGKMVLLALVNLIVAVAIEGGISIAFTAIFDTPEFATNITLPLPWQIFKHTLLILTARETLGYYIHRFILHGRSPLKEQHIQYAHSRPGAPSSLQLFVDHPLPSLLYRFVPLYLPALLLRPHILTYFLVLALCTVEETLSMSGYTVVPGIIMSGIVQRSAVHYAGRGTSNFGVYGILDWAHGTGRGRDMLDDATREVEKHSAKARSVLALDKPRDKSVTRSDKPRQRSVTRSDKPRDRSVTRSDKPKEKSMTKPDKPKIKSGTKSDKLKKKSVTKGAKGKPGTNEDDEAHPRKRSDTMTSSGTPMKLRTKKHGKVLGSDDDDNDNDN